LKQEDYDRRLREYEEQQREIARMQEYINRNIVRASTTKMAQSRRNALGKMAVIEKPYVYHKLPVIHFSYPQDPVKDILEVSDMKLAVGTGETYKLLAENINLHVERGDRLAIIGTNGIGKSTFLKAIQRRLPFERGNVTWGQNVRYSFFEQEMQMLDPDNTILEELWKRYPGMSEQSVRSALGAVLLTGENVYKRVGVISGGERVKLSLAILMQEHSNVLIMDEPTNHLDIYTKEVLEKALLEYEGTLILVSHDRYLLNKVPTRIMEMRTDGVELFNGRFDEYQEYKKLQTQIIIPQEVKKSDTTKSKSDYRGKQRRSQEAKIRQRVRELEQLIEKSESEVSALEQELTLPEVYQDYKRMEEVCAKLEEAKQLYSDSFDEWAELSEMM